MNKKKSIKTKIASLLAGVLSVALLAGCSQSNTANSETKDEKVYKIGVTQFADHPSLDNCKNGFIAGLKDEGFEVKNPTRKTAVMIALYKKAASGDLSAIKELRSIVSEKDSEKTGTTRAVTIIDDVGN